MNIASELANTSSLVELLQKAKSLKEKGCDPMEVNAVVTRRRKELAEMAAQTGFLKKTLIPGWFASGSRVSMIVLNVENKSKNSVTISPNGEISW